jgi:hemoglobin
VIGHIFTDVAKVDWEKHLPVMYDFWASLLFDEQSYTGNPMLKHISLNKLTPLGSKEFSTWLDHFRDTVVELFEGPKAEEAMARAEHIAALMEYKIRNSNGMHS